MDKPNNEKGNWDEKSISVTDFVEVDKIPSARDHLSTSVAKTVAEGSLPGGDFGAGAT